ncbi:hypothetical protein K439DRAFT_1621329 [Ramaria rubella]|nr:hypothetical protein K439DRAFT_1621329 [Ramaria rubella]
MQTHASKNSSVLRLQNGGKLRNEDPLSIVEWLTACVGTLEVDDVDIDDSSKSGPGSSSQVQDLLISTGIDTQEAQFNTTVDVRNNLMGISVESEDSDPLFSDLESVFDSEESACRPSISSTYIEIVHHPHSGLEPEYIFCDLGSPTKAPLSTPPQLAHGERPWAPFRTRADFEFAETAVQSAMGAKTIKKLI